MRQLQQSSTRREVDVFTTALRELQRSRPQLLQGGRVQIHSDSAAAVADCSRMRGAPDVFPAIRALFSCSPRELQLTLHFVWHPRTAAAARLADALSKHQDSSDWALSRTFAQQQIFGRLHIDARTQVLDCMASALAHQSEVYFAELWDEQGAAVDGLAQRWSRWPVGTDRSGKPVCFVFPPVGALLQAVLKVEAEQADALIVCPRIVQPAVSLVLRRLPAWQHAGWCNPVQLHGEHKHMVRPTERVPAGVVRAGWVVPLQVWAVKW